MSQTSVLDYTLHISVKKSTKVALEILAEKDRRSLNAYTRMILEDHISSKEIKKEEEL
ncbi:MAG: hypothetical protein NT096_00050 [Proteobacteria bacterium]|nr:hypothetical protein [Pseudomonadota bacterium]